MIPTWAADRSGMPLVRLPVLIQDTTTKGWHDLSMFVTGGGITNGHWVILRFDGRRYHQNPSTAHNGRC